MFRAWMSNISKRFIADPYSFIFRSCLLRRYFLFSFSPPLAILFTFSPVYLSIYLHFPFVYLHFSRVMLQLRGCYFYARIKGREIWCRDRSMEIDGLRNEFVSRQLQFRSTDPKRSNVYIYIYIQSEIIPVDLNHRGKSMHAGEGM